MTTFRRFRKLDTRIVYSLEKNTCIVCTTFPSCPYKCELHVKTTGRHDVLCWDTFPTKKRNLKFRWNCCTNMCPINCTNTVLQVWKEMYYDINIVTKYTILVQTILNVNFKNYLEMWHKSSIHRNLYRCVGKVWISWFDDIYSKQT